MKRSGLLVAALFVLPLTAAPVRVAAWSPHAGQPALARPDRDNSRDERVREAVWHWRACRPNHWRDCLLQR
jgi:hypothetical protein